MKPLFFNTLKGLAVFAASAALLLLLLCLVAIRFEEPSSLVPVFSGAALLLSAFLCGRASASEKYNRILSGLISGLAAMLLILLITLVFSSLDVDAPLRMALTVLISVLGAVSKKSGEKVKGSARKRKNIQKRYASYGG